MTVPWPYRDANILGENRRELDHAIKTQKSVTGFGALRAVAGVKYACTFLW